MSIVDFSHSPAPDPGSTTRVELDRIATWNVYGRLKELSIPCRCQCGQPLEVNVGTVNQALQLWSVVQQFTASKQSTVNYLERCWAAAENL
jgi:hypothetical protein